MPAIVGFHVDADPLVPIAEDRKGVRLLEKRGESAELRGYPGVGHELLPALRGEFFASLSRALARAELSRGKQGRATPQ